MVTRDEAKKQFFDRACTLVCGERADDYGDASDSFRRVAVIWKAILGTEITPRQVALCLAGVKLARLAVNRSHEDSWIDLAGYAGCGYAIEDDDDI